jgi:uncharacterized protein YecT (DUF1311 family)
MLLLNQIAHQIAQIYHNQMEAIARMPMNKGHCSAALLTVNQKAWSNRRDKIRSILPILQGNFDI